MLVSDIMLGMDKQKLLDLKADAEKRHTELNQQYIDLGMQRDTVLTESVRVQGDLRTYDQLIALLPIEGEVVGEPDAANTSE